MKANRFWLSVAWFFNDQANRTLVMIAAFLLGLVLSYGLLDLSGVGQPAVLVLGVAAGATLVVAALWKAVRWNTVDLFRCYFNTPRDPYHNPPGTMKELVKEKITDAARVAFGLLADLGDDNISHPRPENEGLALEARKARGRFFLMRDLAWLLGHDVPGRIDDYYPRTRCGESR